MRLRLLVASDDLSTQWLQPFDGDWTVERAAYGGIDNFSFELEDQGSTLSLTPLAEIVLEDFSDTGNRVFGGKLTEINQVTLGLGRRFQCKALGWVFDLERATVTDIYRGASDQQVIASDTGTPTRPRGIFLNSDKDLSDYTLSTNNIKEGNANTQKMVFNGETIRSVMDTLADWQSFVWKIDPDQTVFYRPAGEDVSTFSLSDSPDDVNSFPYYTFQRFRDASKVVNAVTIFGGDFREIDDTKIYPGTNGVDLLYRLGLRWRKSDTNEDDRILVSRNTGTSGSPVFTNMTVAVPGQTDSSTFDVVWDELVNTLEFTTAPPAFDQGFQVNGDVWRPLIGEDVDQDSIDEVGRFQLTIKDPSLTDDAAVERRASIELNKNAQAAEQITLVTNQDGAQPGQLINLTNVRHNIAGNRLIDRIVIRPVSDTFQEYELSLRRITGST